MSYDLTATNREAGDFPMGGLAWPVLLEQCGAYFICLSKGPSWFYVKGVDERMDGCDSPKLVTNDGFPVTDEEAKVMARIARNFVAVQRSLKWPEKEPDFLAPEAMQPWPRKIREGFVDLFERFAEWAEKSGGFEIH